MTIDISATANRSLKAMMAAGFDVAQVSLAVRQQDEVSIAQNEPSLLRTTEDYQLALTGIVDSRKASAVLTDLDEGTLAPVIAELIATARLSPRDTANAVSTKQTGNFEQGPLVPDLNMLTTKVQEMLAWRAANTPKMNVEEGIASHARTRTRILTSEGTDLFADTGCYQLMVFGSASDGQKTSSFNYAGGACHDLGEKHASEFFGISEVMRDTEQQIETHAFDGNFTGDVILAPAAVSDLLQWLLGQISDYALISDSSLFKDKVGERIASDLLDIRSRFTGPGSNRFTADGFVADDFDLVASGKLKCLLPSFYGSRKTGIAHTPAASGWVVSPGQSSLDELVSDVTKGAIVNRLSMGAPGANGDFSGVIKNSFKIQSGKRGEALAETMISGNMAKMLRDISGISKEHRDTGGEDLPWIRIPGLHFS